MGEPAVKQETGPDLGEILERYPSSPEYLIFLLQDIQAAFGYISPEALKLATEHARVPLTRGYAVATFYKSFSLEPRGEHEIKVCLGTACHLKGGARIVEELSRRLGIRPGQTTEDLKFTLETVNCLGACALGPMVVVDDKYHSRMDPAKLAKLLKRLED